MNSDLAFIDLLTNCITDNMILTTGKNPNIYNDFTRL